MVFALCLVGLLLTNAEAAQPEAGHALVFIGSYARKEGKGIHVYRMDLSSGALKPMGSTGGIENPSFLALHPHRPLLYAVSETERFRGRMTGSVGAFSIDPESGSLKLLNQEATGGGSPCHLVVDGKGNNVLVANYGGGSVAVLPIGNDGRLGRATAFIQHRGSSVNPRRQKGPHAHSICLDAASRFAFAADLGLDRVLIYRYGAGKGTLVPAEIPWVAVDPGSGPRHFAFHTTGKYAYVINELRSTVTAFRYRAERGILEPIQTISTLPAGFGGRSTAAEVAVHPSGKFLYGSNRGHDSIAIFAIDRLTGRLTLLGHQPTGGKTPRNFEIDPSGNFLLAANQNSGTVIVFKIDGDTGSPRPTGTRIEVPAPVCVKMLLASG